MSKIPQGEWSAIAARYAQGESISRIAQSYGCTPPAIHYILKRNKQRAASGGVPPMDQSPQPRPRAALETSQALVKPETTQPLPGGEGRDSPTPVGARPEAPLASAQPDYKPRPQPIQSGQVEQTRPHFLPPAPGARERASMGLDRELHCRAEAAIEAFRSSFDAALAEGSPGVRQQLRRAAADLMRVAARTTIVLDQLNARAERQEPGRI
jgi:hypothetical protein